MVGEKLGIKVGERKKTDKESGPEFLLFLGLSFSFWVSQTHSLMINLIKRKNIFGEEIKVHK